MGATENAGAAAATLLVWRQPDTPGTSETAAATVHLDLLFELALSLPTATRFEDDAALVQLMVDSRHATQLLSPKTGHACVLV